MLEMWEFKSSLLYGFSIACYHLVECNSHLSISESGNYTILREYIKCVLPPLTEVVSPTN